MYKNLMLAVPGAVGLVLWLSVWPASPPVTRDLTVSRQQTTTLPDTRADAILANASTLLQHVDGPSDAGCDVALQRSGGIQTFSVPIDVTNSTSYAVACKRPGRVHVVKDITYCGQPCPNCVGCADVGGSCITVIRHTESLEGILWAHEYGHNAGNRDVVSPGNVMHDSLGAANVSVTAAQCGRFLAGAALAPPQTGAPALQPARTIDEFVGSTFIHGVPYDEARRFGPPAVDRLLQMLKDPPEGVLLSNVVLTLGMIGDPRATPALRQFISDGANASVPREVMVAKRSSLVALGYLYFRTQDSTVLKFLQDGATPEFWSNVQWRPQDDSVRVSRMLALTSLQALGVTGSPDAEAFLRQPAIAGIDPEFAAVAADASRLNALVQKQREAAFTRPQ